MKLDVCKTDLVNIDSSNRHLSIFILRRQETIASGGTNILIKEYPLSHGTNTRIDILENHILMPYDRLFFNAQVADKIILNMTGLAFSE
jgi:hypothetical protein